VPASAGTTAASTFSKTGTDPTTGSTATSGAASGATKAGDTINWVLSYLNTTGSSATTTITDPIGPNQTYVSGSLKTPPDLAPAWSTNGGASYMTPEPTSGVNALKASGVTAGNGTVVPASPPTLGFNAGSSQGDGWEALFIGGNVYNIHHHRPAGSTTLTMLDCHVKATGAECPGYPVQYVSPTAGAPFGTGPDTLMTPTYNNATVDAASGKIFSPVGVNGSTSIGVLCTDVATGTSCGYTQLGNTAFPNSQSGNGAAPGVSGGARIGNNYYIIGTSAGAPVYCYDVTTQARCAGWPAAGAPSDPSYNPTSANGTSAFELESYGGYIFTNVVQDVAPYPRDLGCIVQATGARCSGFPVLG
jgi:hypothetical protein